ncbi:MAG: SulP family inorganic anion transporter [Bacteroidota bacterium]
MNSKNILVDLKAGIVVFLVALPLSLGIALACNVPLFSGILSGVIGGIIVTAFSGSILSVSGAAAGLTAVVLSSVLILGSFPVFLAAVLCAGVLQIVFGLLKAGSVGNYIPATVIKGMLAGIGLILIIKQLPHLVGYDKDPEGSFYFEQSDGHNTISELFYMFNAISPGAVVVGILSMLLLIISGKDFYKKNKVLSFIPGPLLVVIFGILLNISFLPYPDLKIDAEHLVTLPVINDWTDFKSNLVQPDFSTILTGNFWVVAFTVAIVASLESLLSIEAVDKLDPEKRDSNSNRELIAQGVGNITCGLVGALPVTAVIVRSSANINAGATSKISAFIHAILLFTCVLLIPHVLGYIPNASLAAILIMTGYKLTQLSLFKHLYKKGWDQFLPFVVTIVVMLLTDLLKGVGAGLIVAVIFIIRSNIKFSFDTAEDVIDGTRHYMVKLPQQITFFNKGYLIRYFRTIKQGSKVIIDGSINKTTDKDVKEVMEDFMDTAKNRKIEVELIKYEI